jgi:hypothetical protein
MENFLEIIYRLFERWFGQHLAEYLSGWNCELGVYSNPNLFYQVGLQCIVITIIVSFIYYYVLNLVRYERIWWFTFLLLVMTINFVIGFWMTYSAMNTDIIGDCLMYIRDDDGEIVNRLIYSSNCVKFGIANMIISGVLFLIVSIVMKTWSRTCKYYPF